MWVRIGISGLAIYCKNLSIVQTWNAAQRLKWNSFRRLWTSLEGSGHQGKDSRFDSPVTFPVLSVCPDSKHISHRLLRHDGLYPFKLRASVTLPSGCFLPVICSQQWEKQLKNYHPLCVLFSLPLPVHPCLPVSISRSTSLNLCMSLCLWLSLCLCLSFFLISHTYTWKKIGRRVREMEGGRGGTFCISLSGSLFSLILHFPVEFCVSVFRVQ